MENIKKIINQVEQVKENIENANKLHNQITEINKKKIVLDEKMLKIIEKLEEGEQV